MEINQLISKDNYEVFEIHTMPRGIVCLTLRINKPNISQAYKTKDEFRHVHLPEGTMTISIGLNEVIPEYANFLPSTRSFNKIHKRINAIKDALNNTNLSLFYKETLIQPYKYGTRYDSKGVYVGIREELIKNTNTLLKYHMFNNINGNIYKEYINEIT